MALLSAIGTRRTLAITLCVAFLLRVAAAIGVQDWVNLQPGRICLFAGDAEGYWELARRLAHGEDYAVHDPARRVLRMPGFPLILAAALRVTGERVLPVRILLAAVGTLACGLVYWLGVELFDATTGGVAAIFAAISPAFILFSVLLLSETSFAAALVGSLILFARLWNGRAAARPGGISPPAGSAEAIGHGANRDLGAALWAGLMAGVATLIHPTWLLAAPAFVACDVWRCRFERAALIRGAVILGGLAAALLPWTVRNGFATNGHFVPTTLWVGASLYDGLNPGATGASDMRFIETDGLYAGMRGPEDEFLLDQHYRRLAWNYVRANPARAACLALAKLRRFWSFWPNADAWRASPAGGVLAAYFAVMLVLAAAGAWRWRHWPRAWLFALLPILYLSAVHTVFVGSIRYRLPGEYALVVLAAAAMRTTRPSRVAAPVVARVA